MTLPMFQNKEILAAKVAAVVEARLVARQASVKLLESPKTLKSEGSYQPKLVLLAANKPQLLYKMILRTHGALSMTSTPMM